MHCAWPGAIYACSVFQARQTSEADNSGACCCSGVRVLLLLTLNDEELLIAQRVEVKRQHGATLKGEQCERNSSGIQHGGATHNATRRQ